VVDVSRSRRPPSHPAGGWSATVRQFIAESFRGEDSHTLHVIVWGGLRGALALALALSLENTFPGRARVLDLTFGVVIFSILVQGLTIKPMLRTLRLVDGSVATES
jgi:CPA1 family monovalent cation:H+ antiporter